MADVEEGSSNTEEVTKVISVSNEEDLTWVIENQELLKKHGFMIDAGMFKQGLINNPQPSTNTPSTKQRTPPSKSKASNSDDVYVEILEQPQQRGLRFRYECESRFGGSIHGERSVPTKKTFPTIKIHNYVGTAVIVVSCVTKDTPYKPHPHNLVGKNCRRGVCTIKVTDSNVISFPHLSIQCAKKKDIIDNLKQRQDINVDPFLSGFKHIDTAMNMDRNVVRLCFQVFIPDDNGKITRIIAPVVSHPIFDKKSLNELMICRVSKSSGSAKGGDEIFLLCEKINREDIDVRFFKTAKGGFVEWEDFGLFSSYDIHRQYAIVFKTPAYKDKYITRPVEVHMQLMCKNSTDCSDPVQYVYLPEDPDPDSLIKLKKRKVDHLKQFGLYSDSSSMMFSKAKQPASKLKQKDEEMETDTKAEAQKTTEITEKTRSEIQLLMERIKQNAASMSAIKDDQSQKAEKSPSRRGLRRTSRNNAGRQRSRSRSQERDPVVTEKVTAKMKRKAKEDLKVASKSQSPKKVDSKDSGIDVEEHMDGDLKIVETPEMPPSAKLPRLGVKQTQTVHEKVNDRKEFVDQNALQKQLLDQTNFARSLKSKAKNTRNMKSPLQTNTQVSETTGHELLNRSAEKRKLDEKDLYKIAGVEMAAVAACQTLPSSQKNGGNILVPVTNYAITPAKDVIRHRDMKLEELTSLLTQNLLTLIEEINPIIVLYCLLIHHPEVAEYRLSLQQLKSRKQRAVRFLLDLVINHKEWIPAFWDVIATDYNHCYESILSKEVPPSLHLEEQQMCIDCSRKAFNEFISKCSYIPEELLIQLLQREVLEADDVLLLNNCSNEKEKIQLLRRLTETNNIPWIKFIESVCPLPDKEADRLKRIVDKMDFLPCTNCGRAYSIMKCLCKNENGSVSQGSKVFNLKVENVSSRGKTNKIAVFTLNVDEKKEKIVETILAKKEIINSAIAEYGVIENAWSGSVVIVLKLTNQSGEISDLENGILKIVTKIFEDEDIKSHLCETELDMEVNVGDDDEHFNEDVISKKIAILSNFTLLQEELDVKNFMQAFEKKGLMNKIEFSNRFCRKRLPRKQCMLHFLEYVLKNGGSFLQTFFDVIEQDNFYDFLRTSLNKCVNNTRMSLSKIKTGVNSDSVVHKESTVDQEEAAKVVQQKARKQIDLLLREKGNNGKISSENKKEIEESTASEKSPTSKEMKKLLAKSSKTPRKARGGKTSIARRASNDSNMSQSVTEGNSTSGIASKQKQENQGTELNKINFAGDNSALTSKIGSKQKPENEGTRNELKINLSANSSDSGSKITEKGMKSNSVGSNNRVNVPIGKAILMFNDNRQVTLPVVVSEMSTNKKHEMFSQTLAGSGAGDTRHKAQLFNIRDSVASASRVIDSQTETETKTDKNQKIPTKDTEVAVQEERTVTSISGKITVEEKNVQKDNEGAIGENKNNRNKMETDNKDENTTKNEEKKEMVKTTKDKGKAVGASTVLLLFSKMTGSETVSSGEINPSIKNVTTVDRENTIEKTAQQVIHSPRKIQKDKETTAKSTRISMTTIEKGNLSTNEKVEMDTATNSSKNETDKKEKGKSTSNVQIESEKRENETGLSGKEKSTNNDKMELEINVGETELKETTNDQMEGYAGTKTSAGEIVVKDDGQSPKYSQTILDANTNKCSYINEAKMETGVKLSLSNKSASEMGEFIGSIPNEKPSSKNRSDIQMGEIIVSRSNVKSPSKNESDIVKGETKAEASRTRETVFTAVPEKKISFSDKFQEWINDKMKPKKSSKSGEASRVQKLKTNSDSALLLNRRSKVDSHSDSTSGRQSLVDSRLAPNACNVRLEKLEMQLQRATNLSLKNVTGEDQTKSQSGSSGNDIITSGEKQDNR